MCKTRGYFYSQCIIPGESNSNNLETKRVVILYSQCVTLWLKGKLAIFYILAKYVPGDIKYIFTKLYRHFSTNNEANRKFVILISNFSTRL